MRKTLQTFILLVLCVAMITITIVIYLTNFIPSYAFSQPVKKNLINSSNTLKITLKSPPKFQGIAGQFMKIEGEISNPSPNTIMPGGIAYISIVDTKEKIPIDLEDWSVEKGLYIPIFQPSQKLPLEWDIRLVKAGSYAVDILFNIEGGFSSPPIASSKIQLEVLPKLNLNPSNILLIAFGVPGILIGIFGILNYIRGKKMGIYN